MTGMPTSDMTLVALLDMREFFSDPKHWTKRVHKRGERYCLLGYASEHWHSFVGDYLDMRARAEIGPSEVGCLREAARFNDTHEHAEVLAFLDRAIATYKAPSFC
jgi:hypothetical protein